MTNIRMGFGKLIHSGKVIATRDGWRREPWGKLDCQSPAGGVFGGPPHKTDDAVTCPTCKRLSQKKEGAV